MSNLCIFTGRLGDDPEMKSMTDGKSLATFSLAATEVWVDKNGDKQKSTEWIRCVAFGRTAEVAGKYLSKGSHIYVEGKWKTKKWDKDGETRYSTECVVGKLEMVGGPRRNDPDEPNF